MKKLSLIVLLLTAIFSLSALSKNEESSSNELLVYCYDSFASEWGPGPAIVQAFEEETGIKVILQAPGDGITVLTQLELEKENPRADVVVGLDNNLVERALNSQVLQPYKSPLLESVDPELILDDSYHLIPYDWGFFAICYDSEKLTEVPHSLESLTSEIYKNSIILMDPRTSTPGMGFFLWTLEVYGDNWKDYWKRLKPNLLTVVESWSTGYGLFTSGEAPMVLSYSSSPAYHVEYEGTTRYQALIFDEGHPVQIEGAGLVKGSDNLEAGKLFLDFLLSQTSQEAFALSNIMFPVIEDTPLPESFAYALKSDKIITPHVDQEQLDIAIEEWLEIMGE